MSKSKFKEVAKSKVLDFWEKHLRKIASPLLSLQYFNPHFMSLSKPHPLWKTCGDNSFEVSKAIIQAKFHSGRYRTDKLLHGWIKLGILDPGCRAPHENGGRPQQL